MRKLKNFIQLGLLVGLMTVFTNNVAKAQVTASFFGQNAWMPDTIGSTFYNGKLHSNWGNVKNSGAAIVRFGGTSVDHTQPTKYQYIKMIDSIRGKGMEPMLQVPFNNGQFSAQNAASIVQYINITKGKNVKYWVIGNEPDLAYSFTNAAQVAAYIKSFSSAMKAVDPTIKIVGPETAWFNQGILNGLTTANGPDDITGKDGAGRYYIDIFSFHTYPFNGSQSRAQVITKLTAAGSLQDNLVLLNQRVAACNTAHGRTGANAIKTAITEGNISYQNNVSDDLYGVGTNSFIGGQFVAEMMAIAMKNNVSHFHLWSVIEGGSNSPTNIGYIDPVTKNKKPLYHHYKMLADNFRGTYANGTTNQANVKAFATKNGQNIVVMLMNQDLSTAFNYTMSFNTAAIAGNSALKVNIDAGLTAFHTDALQPQSTVVLVFNTSGVIIRKIEYGLDTHAASNLAPTVTNYNGVTTGVNDAPAGQGRKSFGIQNVFPIPAVGGHFTLQVEKGDDARNEDFQVQIFNILGHEVYNKKLPFANGKEEIEMNAAVATGQYFVRVREGSKENFQVKKIMLQKQ